MKIEAPLERQEQVALVQWLSYHPLLKDFFHKNDNEGKRTPTQGHRLKMLGLRPGVSDLFVFHPSKTKKYPGLYLEVKRNKKYSLSERLKPTWVAQEKFQADAKRVGYAAEFCYGWEHGKKIIEEYLQS